MSIKSLLMKKPEKMHLIQVRISEKLVDELKPFMKRNHFKWADVVRASLIFLRDEIKEKK